MSAPTKTSQALASVSLAAAGTQNTSTFDIGIGASGVATITNGATGPTVACDMVVQVSIDGTTWITWYRQTSATGNSVVSTFQIGLPLGGGGDFQKYRIQFNGNTAQSVTVQYDGSNSS